VCFPRQAHTTIDTAQTKTLLNSIKNNNKNCVKKNFDTKKGKNMAKTEKYSLYFSLVSYLETDEDILQRINKQNTIINYAFICHDKDIKDIETGELKQKHYHILIHLSRSNRLDTVRNWFADKNKNINCLGQVIRDTNAILDYPTHANEPSKYQYSIEDINHNDLDFWKTTEMSRDISMDIIKDMLNGLNTYKLCERYGRDYIYHIDNYKKACNDIVCETNRAENLKPIECSNEGNPFITSEQLTIDN